MLDCSMDSETRDWLETREMGYEYSIDNIEKRVLKNFVM